MSELKASLDAPSNAGEDEAFKSKLHDLCEPWSYSTGPVPDYESPLNGVFCSGMLYTERLLAKLLDVKNYEGGDGSEDFDSDATVTLINILTEAGAWDRDECCLIARRGLNAPTRPGDEVTEAVVAEREACAQVADQCARLWDTRLAACKTTASADRVWSRREQAAEIAAALRARTGR